MSEVLVFAYGSNMYTPRLYDRVSQCEVVTTGYVRQRTLTYHKRGDDGSAKADAWFTGLDTDTLWGVVYRLGHAQKSVLDKFESLGTGYDESTVDVIHEGGVIMARTYTARSEMLDASLRPFCWYHNFIVEGAREHGLPDEYQAWLAQLPTTPDPDANRASRNLAIVSVNDIVAGASIDSENDID